MSAVKNASLNNGKKTKQESASKTGARRPVGKAKSHVQLNAHWHRMATHVDTVQAKRSAGASNDGHEQKADASTLSRQEHATGMPLPLQTGLEALSGLDLSGIRVHRNSAEPSRYNALAYTQGADIHLGAGQEKHLPHEGWHAVQQMQGRVNPGFQEKGVAINSDTQLEREADDMGSRALQVASPRQEAMSALPQAARESQSSPTVTEATASAVTKKKGAVSPAKKTTSKTVQRYVKYTAASQGAGSSLGWKHPGSNYLKVAEDGEIAIGGYQEAWATDARRIEGEKALKKNYSDVTLEKGSRTVSGKSPKVGAAGSNITLTEVKANNRFGGGRADLTADCGTAARQILGLNKKTDKFSARVEPAGVPTLTTPETYHGGAYTSPDFFVDEVLKMHFGAGATRAMYQALPDSDPVAFDKDDFDKKYKINKYAVPELGQAITANEPKDWNFHFAGVLMKSTEDYVTGENWPNRATGRDAQSWYFSIYGPQSKSQTFHDKWKDAGGGTTTMVIDVNASDRPIIMLRRAINNKDGEAIVKALRNANALAVPLKSIINHSDTGLMKLLYATSDKHIKDVLGILKTNYLPSLTAAERTALVVKGAKGYTFEREVNLIKSIMEVSTTTEYVDIVKTVEKDVPSESDDIIVDSLIDSSGKLALSRVPAGLTSKQAILLLKSLISGLCIGDDERAVLLILQSLTAPVFQATVNKLSLKYIDSGLDGQQWDKFLVLAASRYPAGQNIAAWRIATENNDDAARMLVYKTGIKDKLSYTEWLGVIRALLSGSCGDADEQAIIKIVRWFAADSKLGLINSSIGEDAMDSGVDGQEWRTIAGIMRGAGYDW